MWPTNKKSKMSLKRRIKTDKCSVLVFSIVLFECLAAFCVGELLINVQNQVRAAKKVTSAGNQLGSTVYP